MTITLTYDETLSRVVITGTDLPDGVVRIERSINGLLWTTVRGGASLPVDGGGFQLYDYEFIACAQNFYRAGPGIVETITAPSTDQVNGDDWTVPLGVTELTFEAWGGGGRAQGNTPPAFINSARPGGGGAAYSRSNIPVSPGETLTIRVGEGGHDGGQTGDHDGASSWIKRNTATLLEAAGGEGASGPATPGAGGDAAFSVGQIRQSGGTGGLRESDIGAGGGGGGSAFANSNGLDGAPGAAGIGGLGGDGYGDGGAGGAGEPGLRLTGSVGAYASTPDEASLDIVGDLDIRAMVATTDWTPGSQVGIVSKWNTVGNQRSFLLSLMPTGVLRFNWSINGTASLQAESTVAVAPASGPLAVRATLDVDNGAAGRTVTFWTAPASPTAIDFGPWTQLGVPVITATVTSIFVSTAQVEVGSWSTGTSPFTGTAYAAQIRNGIDGTVVADPHFYEPATDTPSFADATTKTWTVNGTARIINEPTAGSQGQGPGGGGGGQGNNQIFQPGIALGGDGASGQLNVYSWYGYPFDTAGLSLPGTAGSYASTPDTAVLDIVGDIDLRADLTPDSWNPGVQQAFLTKYDSSVGQRSYYFRIDTSGLLTFLWSVDGAAFLTATSTVVPAPGPDGRLAVRVTMDVDNGVGQHDVRFWTADTMAGPWTQLGAAFLGGGVTSIFAGTADLIVGGRNGGTEDLFDGVVHSVQVRTGIDGVQVANPDFDAQAPGTTVFTDAAGREWTLFGDAEIQGSATFEDSITPVLDQVWLKSIKYPFLNRPVDCPNYGDKTRTFRGGVFDVQGRSMPIAVTDLKRSKAWTMTILTHTLEEARDMDLILAANQVMFVHVPCEDVDGCGPVAAVPGGYVVTLDTVEHRTIAGSRTREWILPLREVVQPSAEIVGATMIWRTVLNTYGSWEALTASNPTWLDLLRDVASEDALVVL